MELRFVKRACCSLFLFISSMIFSSTGPAAGIAVGPLTKLIIDGHYTQLADQLKQGKIDVNKLNSHGLTPLQEAVCAGQSDLVCLLCDHKATDVNKYSSKGFTALHYAIAKSNCRCEGQDICDSCKIINSLFRNKSLIIDRQKRYCYRILTYIPFHCIPADEGRTALHIAAAKGDSKNVERLLKGGANANALTYWGRSPLHYAAYGSDKPGNYKETMDLLYNARAFVDQEDYCGVTPLIMAIKSHKIRKTDGSLINTTDLVEWLLLHDADVNKKSAKQTPLIVAVNQNDLAMVELLLKYGAQIDLKNEYGRTALDLAISGGFEEIQRYLISKGGHYTVGKRYLETLEASPKWILYPLHEAAEAGRLDSLQVLLSQPTQFPCLVNGFDDIDRIPLHYAARKDFDESVLFLLSQGSQMKAKDLEGKTPLEYAVENGALKSVKCFLAQHGVDEYLKSKKGDITVGTYLLDIAASKGHEDVVLELKKHGAIILGNSLIWAVRNNLQNIAREILMGDKAKELLQGKDSYGHSALDIAVEQRNTEMIKILLQSGAPTETFLKYLNELKVKSAATPTEGEQAKTEEKKPSLEEVERLFSDLTDIETIVAKHRSFNENDEKENFLNLQNPELKDLGMHGFIRASLQHFRGAGYTKNYSGYYALFNAINPLEAHDSNRREQFAGFFKTALTCIKQRGINPPYDNLTAQQLRLLLEEIKRNPQEFSIKSTDILDKIIILPSENLNALLKGEKRLEEVFDEKTLDAFNRFTSGEITCLSLIVSDRLQKDWFSIIAYKKENEVSVRIYHSGLRINQWSEQLLNNICYYNILYYYMMLMQPTQKWKEFLNETFKIEIDKVYDFYKKVAGIKSKSFLDDLTNFTECLLSINDSIGYIRSEPDGISSTVIRPITHALRLGALSQGYDLLFKKLFGYFGEIEQKSSLDKMITTFIIKYAVCVEQLKEKFYFIAFDTSASSGIKNLIAAEMREHISKIIADINILKNEIAAKSGSLTSGKFYDAAPGEIPAEKFKIIEKFLPEELKRFVRDQKSSATGGRLLFYGEPGNGKTTMAQALAKLCPLVGTDGVQKDRPFHIMRVPSMGTKYKFSKQNQLSALHEYIKENPYAVILLDEIDALSDSEYAQDQSTQDLQQLMDYADCAHIIFIGTTNSDIPKLDSQDSSDKQYKQIGKPLRTRFIDIKIENPTLEHRRAIIQNCRVALTQNNPYLSVILSKQEEDAIAQHTNGFSIRDIETVFTVAQQNGFRSESADGESSSMAQFKQITYSHFNEAMQAIKKGKRINYMHYAMSGLKAFAIHGPNWIAILHSLYSTYRHEIERKDDIDRSEKHRREDRLERYRERYDELTRSWAMFNATQAKHESERAQDHAESRQDHRGQTIISGVGLALQGAGLVAQILK